MISSEEPPPPPPHPDKNTRDSNPSSNEFSDNIISQSQFLEIAPLEYEINDLQQKDLASVPISDVDLPDIAYMVVDKNIELSIKYLKDYPEWQFLSQDELNRKTIEIYFDLKTAKRCCHKEQKIIKVPNTNLFKLVAPILLKKGISRIVSVDKLIALWIIYFSFLLLKSIFRRLPVKDPLIKLTPIMKLIGKLIVSVNMRLTFFLIELFWIPIIKIKNNDKL